MHYEEFLKSLSENKPPENMPPLLKALWYDGKGNWDGAHDVAQDIHNENGSWIHAYLHRKEGDISNARYWYSRAGRSEPRSTLGEEWEMLVRDFLKSES